MQYDKSQQFNIVKAFIDRWIYLSSAKSISFILQSSFGVFSLVEISNRYIFESPNQIKKDQLFDLVLGDLPIGMARKKYVFWGEELVTPRNWKKILESLNYLGDNGTAFYVLEPIGFSTLLGVQMVEVLNKHGFYVSAYINLPEGIGLPLISITPILVAITKRESSRLFIAELLSENQAEAVADAYFSSASGSDTTMGLFIEPNAFHGFPRLKILDQIEHLETQYKNYSQQTLGELLLEINSVPTGDNFTEKENSIYIPNIGKSPVESRLQDTTLKHQNYFQVVLKEEVNNQYVAAFFRSTLGKLVLASSFTDTYISHLNKSDIEQILVAFPPPEEQTLIVNTLSNIVRLKSALNDFDSELALNPASSSSIQPQLDSMLEAIGSLTDIEKVNALVREGESKTCEFKSSFGLDLKKHSIEKYIETSALKTVVAFLNSEGGVLLIGVADDRSIIGINQEINKFYKNIDKFMLHCKDAFKNRIGEEFYPFIDCKTINMNDGNLLLWVDCKRSPKTPCFLDNTDFYVRTNPATDKLEGQKMLDYVQNHFSS